MKDLHLSCMYFMKCPIGKLLLHFLYNLNTPYFAYLMIPFFSSQYYFCIDVCTKHNRYRQNVKCFIWQQQQLQQLPLLTHGCIQQQQHTKYYRKIHMWGLRGKASKCPYGIKHPKIGGGFRENIRDCKRASIGIFPKASKMCM